MTAKGAPFMPKGPRTAVLLAVVAAGLAVGGAALADAAFSDAVGRQQRGARHHLGRGLGDGGWDAHACVRPSRTTRRFRTDAFIHLWFDLDNNTRTGADGDEANVLYQADGILDFYRWNGRDLARDACHRAHRVLRRRGVHVHRPQERVRRPRELRPPCRHEPTLVRGRRRDRGRLRVRAEQALVRLARPDDVPGSGGRP